MGLSLIGSCKDQLFSLLRLDYSKNGTTNSSSTFPNATKPIYMENEGQNATADYNNNISNRNNNTTNNNSNMNSTVIVGNETANNTNNINSSSNTSTTNSTEDLITSSALVDLLKNDTSNVTLIDVRMPWELRVEGKIGKSINIPCKFSILCNDFNE